MSNFTFDLPHISDADMSSDDQAALVINQATAMIVAAWLDHATAVRSELVKRSVNDPRFEIVPDELPALIDAIQGALKSL